MNLVNSLIIFTISPNIKLEVILQSRDIIDKQNEWVKLLPNFFP